MNVGISLDGDSRGPEWIGLFLYIYFNVFEWFSLESDDNVFTLKQNQRVYIWVLILDNIKFGVYSSHRIL
jgi:hypothetical protein